MEENHDKGNLHMDSENDVNNNKNNNNNDDDNDDDDDGDDGDDDDDDGDDDGDDSDVTVPVADSNGVASNSTEAQPGPQKILARLEKLANAENLDDIGELERSYDALLSS